MRKLFEIGGIIAGAVLIIFGAAAIYMGVDGRTTVRDSLKAGADHLRRRRRPGSRQVRVPVGRRAGHDRHAGARVRPGHPRARARGLRRPDLRADGAVRLRRRSGEPGRHERRDRRAEGREGNPVSNSARNTWVTATALSTALNMSYMAEQMALFGIVVGIALLLSGIGFIVLALVGGALGRRESVELAKREAGSSRRSPRSSNPVRAPKSRAAPAALDAFSDEQQRRRHRHGFTSTHHSAARLRPSRRCSPRSPRCCSASSSPCSASSRC